MIQKAIQVQASLELKTAKVIKSAAPATQCLRIECMSSTQPLLCTLPFVRRSMKRR
jgi:hypothetical protein